MWEVIGTVLILLLFSVFGLTMRDYRDQIRRLERELAASHRRGDDLYRAVKELLATRRRATRERFLHLIEEKDTS